MSSHQDDLIQQVAKFCQKEIAPYMMEDDKNSHFRMEIFQAMGDLGLCGMTLPEQYGGLNLGYQDFSLVLAEVAKYSVAYAVTLSVSTMVASIINEFADDATKSLYLPDLASGKEIGAFALSEAGSGSDAASLQTKAKLDQNNYILNGNKMWITSGGVAKTYIVMARTGGAGAAGISSFIVKKDHPGFSFGKKEDKMGWRSSPTRELIFDNCTLSKKALIGGEGNGFKVAMAALDKGRITIGAIATGLAEQALKEATSYALTRKQFNKPIFEFQGLQFLIAELATEIEASRLLVAAAAQRYDTKKPDTKLAAMCKLKATDTAMKVTTEAIQILGGVGYTTEFPLERYMRDAKVLQIVEGTNQIQKIVISRQIKKELNT